jgi:hypothetical protein
MGKRKLQSVESVRQLMGALDALSQLTKAVDKANNKHTWEQVTHTSDEQLKIETHQTIGKPLRRYRAKVKAAESFVSLIHEKLNRKEPLTAVDKLRAEQILGDLNTAGRALVVFVLKAITATKRNSVINQIGFTSPKRKKSVHITGTVSGIDPPTNLATKHRDTNLGHVAGLLTRAYSLTAWQLPVRNTA